MSHDAYFKRFDELTALSERDILELVTSFGLSAADAQNMDRDALARFVIEAEGRRVVVRRGPKVKKAARHSPLPPELPVVEETPEDEGPTLDSLFSI